MVTLKSNIQSSAARIKQKPKIIPTYRSKFPLTEDKFIEAILFHPKVAACIAKYDKLGVGDSISYWAKRIFLEKGEDEVILRMGWLSDKTIVSSLSGSKRGLRQTAGIANQYGLMAYYLDEQIGLKTAASCIHLLKKKPKLAKAFSEAAGDISVNTGNSAVLQLILANVSRRELGDELIIPITWYSQFAANLSGKDEILIDALVYLSKLDEGSETQALTLLTNISVCGNANRETKDSIAVLISDTVKFLELSTEVTKSSLANLLRSRFHMYPESITRLDGTESLAQKLDFLTRYVLIRDYDFSIQPPSFTSKWMGKAEELIHGPIAELKSEADKKKEREEDLLRRSEPNGQLLLLPKE